SVAELPVSLVRATPGAAGMAVSRVKAKLAAGLALPATSVCRTCTALAPSWAVKLADQVAPPSVEYSTRAPGSLLTVSVPMLVIPSVGELPVSLVRATPGAGGVAVSRVKLKAVPPLPLPATSVCRTCTALLPSTAVKLADQVAPPSVEYSTRAPGSLLTVSVPMLVIPSVGELPVSLVRATPGAGGVPACGEMAEVAARPVPATTDGRRGVPAL